MDKIINLLSNNYILISVIILFAILIISLIVLLIKYINSKKVVFEDLTNEENTYIRESVVNKDSEIEVLLERMEKALQDEKKILETEKSEVEIFEDEQEEKAIISYQELIEASNKNKQVLVSSNNVSVQQKNENKEDLNEIVSIIEEELIEKNEIKEEQKNNNKKKFKSTDFISPVYGIVNSVLDYPKVITKNLSYSKIKKKDKYEMERMLDIEPISDEMKKNDEFLQALKDFRSKLE